jgi:hypothetical protein
VLACTPSKKEVLNNYDHKIVDSIGTSIQQEFKELQINSQFQIEVRSDTLMFRIVYTNNYFITDETNQLILAHLMFKLDTLLLLYNHVKVRYRWDDLADDRTVVYSKKGILENQNKLKNNLCFYRMTRFLIQNISTNDVIGYNIMIKDLREKYLPNAFTYMGTFWLMIYDYSKHCREENSDLDNQMKLLLKASQYPKAPINSKVLEKVIEMCDENYCN